jgi:hypothetical protein
MRSLVFRLSFEEFMGEESRSSRLFRLMDKDGDGYVTKSVNIKFFKILFEIFMRHKIKNYSSSKKASGSGHKNKLFFSPQNTSSTNDLFTVEEKPAEVDI